MDRLKNLFNDETIRDTRLARYQFLGFFLQNEALKCNNFSPTMGSGTPNRSASDVYAGDLKKLFQNDIDGTHLKHAAKMLFYDMLRAGFLEKAPFNPWDARAPKPHEDYQGVFKVPAVPKRFRSDDGTQPGSNKKPLMDE